MTTFAYPYTIAQPVAGGFAAFTYRGPADKAQVSTVFRDIGQALDVADRIDGVGARVLCPAAGQCAAYDADQTAAQDWTENHNDNGEG